VCLCTSREMGRSGDIAEFVASIRLSCISRRVGGSHRRCFCTILDEGLDRSLGPGVQFCLQETVFACP
jgi:hypothetical protein